MTAKRAAIYARFSSDLQSDKSVDDQIALCRSFCEREGHDVVNVWSDHARSGASVFGRDGLMALMQAVPNDQFDVVVVEALDRLSRDQEDLAGIYKRLKFQGVELHAVHDGQADTVQIGIRGLVGQLYLEDLKHKTRRGMSGVVRDGRSAGGRAYGYRPVTGKPGELEIVEEEAAIVRRIFDEFVAGRTPREIAGDLNREGVAPPRGTHWAAATINGNLTRGHGILINPLYSGRIVWNRVHMVKDPDTGKRLSRPNPEHEWQSADAPHLAIVDPDVWAAAQNQKKERSLGHVPRKRKPKHLLSGLLKFGACGGGMSVKDRRKGQVRIICTQSKESGICDNKRPYNLNRIEQAVTAGLRKRLGDRDAIALYIRTYNEERERLAADTVNRRRKLENKIARKDAELDRAIDYAIKGIVTEEKARSQIGGLESELADLRAELEQCDDAPQIVSLHPRAVDTYLEAVARLEATVATTGVEHNQGDAQTAVRDLVEAVIVHPAKAAEKLDIEIRGHFARLIGGDPFPDMFVREDRW